MKERLAIAITAVSFIVLGFWLAWLGFVFVLTQTAPLDANSNCVDITCSNHHGKEWIVKDEQMTEASNTIQDASTVNVQDALQATQADLLTPYSISCVSDLDGRKLNCETIK